MKVVRFGARARSLALLVAAGALASGIGAARAADAKKAADALKAALGTDSADGIRKACDELIDAGGKDAISVVLDLLPRVQGMGYWQLSGAAAGFRDHAALEQLASFVVSHQGDKEAPLVRDLLFNLQNNNSPYVALPLAAALDRGKYDLQLMAADQLGTIRSTEAIEALVGALVKHEKDPSPELKRRIEGSLVLIVGESKGDVASWDSWWKGQKSKGVPEKSSGGGGGTQARNVTELNNTIEKCDPRRIVVLTADRHGFIDDPSDYDFDKVQRILEDKHIPFSLVKKADFDFDPAKYLNGCWALLVNCNFIKNLCVCPGCKWDTNVKVERRAGCNPKCGKHIDKNYRLGAKALKAIKAFVDDGGYLYTEDWGIIEVTQALWPDMVCSGSFGKEEKPRLVRKLKDDKKTPEPTVTVNLLPVPGVTSHPLMRGVWSKPKKEVKKGEERAGAGGTVARDPDETRLGDEMRNHKWDIDDESPAIEVKNQDAVTVLLEAPDLAQIPNVGANTAVAVTFKGGPARRDGATGGGVNPGSREKGGRVLHTMSHFGHQSSSEDGQCLWNLLVNFLLEAVKQHEGPPELPPMPKPDPAKSAPPAPAPSPAAPAPAASPAAPAPAPAASPAAPPPGPAPAPAASPKAPNPNPSVDPTDPNAGRDG